MRAASLSLYDDDDSDDASIEDEEVDDAQVERLRRKKMYETLLESFHQEHTCLICDLPFVQLDNLNGYYCRFHTGRLEQTTRFGDESWSCCGRRETEVGCTRCMHAAHSSIRDEIYKHPADSTLEIPADIIDFKLLPFNENMLLSRTPDQSITNSINDQVLEYKHGKYAESHIDATTSSSVTPVPHIKLVYFILRVDNTIKF